MSVIYLSKSNLTNPETVEKVKALLKGFEVTEYTGGKYSSEPITKCDVLVSVAYAGAKINERIYMGKGTYTEALKASVIGANVLAYDDGFYLVKEVKIFDQKDYKEKFGYLLLGEKVDVDFIKSLPVRTKIDFGGFA